MSKEWNEFVKQQLKWKEQMESMTSWQKQVQQSVSAFQKQFDSLQQLKSVQQQMSQVGSHIQAITGQFKMPDNTLLQMNQAMAAHNQAVKQIAESFRPIFSAQQQASQKIAETLRSAFTVQNVTGVGAMAANLNNQMSVLKSLATYIPEGIEFPMETEDEPSEDREDVADLKARLNRLEEDFNEFKSTDQPNEAKGLLYLEYVNQMLEILVKLLTIYTMFATDPANQVDVDEMNKHFQQIIINHNVTDDQNASGGERS